MRASVCGMLARSQSGLLLADSRYGNHSKDDTCRVLAEGSAGHTLWWVGTLQGSSLSPNDKVSNPRTHGLHLYGDPSSLGNPETYLQEVNTVTLVLGHTLWWGVGLCPVGVSSRTLSLCTAHYLTSPAPFLDLVKYRMFSLTWTSESCQLQLSFL